MSEEPEARAGAVEPRLAAEFPGLMLRWVTVHTSGGPSPPGVRERLHELSDRGRGARVVAMRTQPIAHAYRAFFRQTGLDPDVTRIPSEEAAVARLLQGAFVSRGRVADGLLIALVETGVPVWALAGAELDPASLIIRTARAGEAPGEGHLVIADQRAVALPLFSPRAPDPPRARDLVLVSVGVDGVPAIHVEEALWLCAEILAEA